MALNTARSGRLGSLTSVRKDVMRIYMRTSLEIPDPLFKEAKRLALETDTTLKNLVAEGLELVIRKSRKSTSPTRPDSNRLPKVRPKGEGLYAISPEEIDCILAEEEAADYGRHR